VKRIIFMAIVVVSVTVMSKLVMPADNIPFVQLDEIAVTQIPNDIIIPELGSVVVDAKGNVFGFAGRKNGKECCVIKWDENLRFIKKFSRQGLGPGEISMIGAGARERLSIDPSNGDVVVIDYNPTRLVIFDNNGNHKRDINLLQKNTGFDYCQKFRSLGKGNFAAFKTIDNTKPTECVLFAINPLKEKIIYNFNDTPLYIDKNYGISFSDVYGSRSFIDSDSGYWVIASSQVYKFQVFDNEGNKVSEVFDKNKKIGTFTSSEIEYIKNTKFSPNLLAVIKQDKHYFNKLFDLIKKNKNPVRDIRIGGHCIYLFLVNDDITTENKIPTDIYDLKGKILKTVYFKKIPTKIWKQFAYFAEFDDEDNPVVRKYQIK
jgi:hypothetical protein